MPLPNINFLHVTVSEIWPGQDFSRSRSLRQGQRSNQGQTMMRPNYTRLLMFLPNMNFLHLTVSEIWPGQDFSSSRSLRQGQIKVKLWRGTTTLPNQCSYQIWTSYTLRFRRYGQDKIFQYQDHYGKVKGQIKVKLWRGTTTLPNQCSYQI